MKNMLDDWQAEGITSVLHEKRVVMLIILNPFMGLLVRPKSLELES